MTIWLSWFAARCIQEYKDFEIEEGRICTLDDNTIFRGLMAEAGKAWKYPVIQNEPSERSERAWFGNLVAPIIGKGESPASPLVIRVDQVRPLTTWPTIATMTTSWKAARSCHVTASSILIWANACS